MPRQRAKVFCIGLHKTGTSSLRDALRSFGYRVTGPNWVRERDIAQTALVRALGIVDQYDAFQGSPWPLLIDELDVRYPGSRFILTIRDSHAWLASVKRHFGSKVTPMRHWIYGEPSPVENERLYLQVYQAHNRQVRDSFNRRDDQFLEMNITEGDGWEKLCPFLNLKQPKEPFPHSNSAKQRMRSASPN